MFYSKSEIKLQEECKTLKEKIVTLEARITHQADVNRKLGRDFDEAFNQRIEDIEDCDCEIDFVKLDAFSIERLVHEKREKTGIGYLKAGVIHEWNFTCSRERHAKLVERFVSQVLDKKIP